MKCITTIVTQNTKTKSRKKKIAVKSENHDFIVNFKKDLKEKVK